MMKLKENQTKVVIQLSLSYYNALIKNKKNMKKNKLRHRCSKFISIIYQMLQDEETSLKWNQNQTSFSIVNFRNFIQNSLTKYFKHSNLSSFIRQLNLYGFKKLMASEKTPQNSYYNEMFKKNRPQLLSKIKRSHLNGSKNRKQKFQDSQSEDSYSKQKNEKKTYKKRLQEYQKQLDKIRTQNCSIKELNVNLKMAVQYIKISHVAASPIRTNPIQQTQEQSPQVFIHRGQHLAAWPFINYDNFESMSKINNQSLTQNSQKMFERSFSSSPISCSRSSNNG